MVSSEIAGLYVGVTSVSLSSDNVQRAAPVGASLQARLMIFASRAAVLAATATTVTVRVPKVPGQGP